MSKIKIEEQIGGFIVYLKGDFIGGDETDELRKNLKELAESKKNKIIIDMGKVTYLNSTALGVLISAYASVTKKGGTIVLCNLDKSIENLFVITKYQQFSQFTPQLRRQLKIYKIEYLVYY